MKPHSPENWFMKPKHNWVQPQEVKTEARINICNPLIINQLKPVKP